MAVSLSVCLLIKDEEKNLNRCLSSIKDMASEIIVVDTGSNDNSILIANQFTDQVYLYKWRYDFSSARNYYLERASGDWIMVLDGDEELDRKCLNVLQKKIQVPGIEAYLLFVNHYSHEPHELLEISDLQARLFKNNTNYRYRGIIHEQILNSILDANPSAKIEIAQDISIIHYGYNRAQNENLYRLKRNTDIISKALDRKEEQVLKYFHLGVEYYRHHQFSEALKHFLFVYNRADMKADYIPELLHSIVISLYMLDKAADALDFINNITPAILPNMGDFHYLKAVIHKKASQYWEAYQAFKDCLLNSDQAFHHFGIYRQQDYKIYYYLGSMAEYFMEKDDALYYYLESLKRNPWNLNSLRRIIKILNPRANPDYTVDSLNRVFDLSDGNALAEVASMFCEEGAYQLALDLIGQLEAGGQISESIRLLKGLCLLRNKQFCDSEKELQLITHNVTHYVRARQYLLIYYWLKKDYPKASDCLKRIRTTGPDPTIIYVLQLLIRGYASGMYVIQNQVYPILKAVLDMIVELGNVLQVNEAYQNLTPLLGERPSYLLAELFFKYGRNQLAEEELHKLLEQGNTGALIYYYLGKLCWVRGDLKNAKGYFDQVINNGLDTPGIRWEMFCLNQGLDSQEMNWDRGYSALGLEKYT